MLKHITDEIFIESLFNDNLDEGILNSIFNKLGDAQRFVQAGINKLKKKEKVNTEELVKKIIERYRKSDEIIQTAKNLSDKTQVDNLINKVVQLGDETLPMPMVQKINKEYNKKKKMWNSKLGKIYQILNKKGLNIEYKLTLLYIIFLGQLNFDTVSNVGSDKKKMNIKSGIPIK